MWLFARTVEVTATMGCARLLKKTFCGKKSFIKSSKNRFGNAIDQGVYKIKLAYILAIGNNILALHIVSVHQAVMAVVDNCERIIFVC